MFDYRLVFILLTLLTVGCVEWGSSATVGALDDSTSEPSDESSPSVPSDPSTDDDPGDDAADSTEPDDVVSVAFADDQCEFFVANEERGRGDGVNWDNASPYLREAMVAGLANKNRGVCDAVVVKVGRGIYFPHPRDPDISFPLYGGLELTGGYLESDDNARDLVTAATVLAGRLGEGGPQSLHVLRGSGNGTDEVKLDGLTIQEGRATGLDDDAKGGGIFVEGLILSLTNIVIRDNYAAERGGGLWLDGGQLVEGQVLWLNNTADGEGGAIFARDARAYPYFADYQSNQALRGGAVYIQDTPDWFFQRTSFEENNAQEGGAIYIETGESVKVCRTIFVLNSAQYGGAVWASRTNALSLASTVWTQNQADMGSSVYTEDIQDLGLSQVTMTENSDVGVSNIEVRGLAPWSIHNSILWRNGTELTFEETPSLLSNLLDESVGVGGTNFSGNPSFVAPYSSAPETWDLAVRADSQVIDAGDDTLIRNDFCNQDVNAQPRVQGAAVDMGAYEFSGR